MTTGSDPVRPETAERPGTAEVTSETPGRAGAAEVKVLSARAAKTDRVLKESIFKRMWGVGDECW